MDLSSLRITAKFQKTGCDSEELAWLASEGETITLAPLFTAEEGEKGIVRFILPANLELEHIAKDLTLDVQVRHSDITGLVLQVTPLSSEIGNLWGALLEHLLDHIGKMARIHPRIMVPEFNLALLLEGKNKGSGKIFDISYGGIRVLSDLAVKPGEIVQFHFDFPESNSWAAFARGVSWQGTVKACQSRGFGLEFSENHSFRETVKRLVDHLTVLRAQRLKYPRYSVFEFDVQGALNEADKVQIKDISLSGTYVITKSDIPLDSPVQLRFLETEKFSALETSLDIAGRVARVTPDGLVIQFEKLDDESKRRISAWIKEILGKFSGPLPKEDVPVKATLSISYGSDFLFVREYLYNLSAGGLFLPSPIPLNKGDTVRFVIDFSGTSLAGRFSTPPAFLATVVRASNEGIGVQFVNPDEVRSQLEGVMGDYLRAHASTGRDPMAHLAEEIITEPQPTKSPRFLFSPLQGGLALSVLLLSSAVVVFSFRSPSTSIELEVPSSPERPPANSTSAASAASTTTSLPRSVKMIVNSVAKTVTIADIVDLSIDDAGNLHVLLKSGETLPGNGLVPYLGKDLRQKLEAAIQRHRVNRPSLQPQLAENVVSERPPRGD